MLTAFLFGLAVVGVVGVVVLAILGIKWFVGYCRNKLKQNKAHKLVFADMQDVVDDVIKNKVNNAKMMSLEQLEQMCSDSPYISADYDPETGEVSDYEGFKAENVELQFEQKMKENDGMIVVSA